MSKISITFLTCFAALSFGGVASAGDDAMQAALKSTGASNMVANNLQLNAPQSDVAKRSASLATAFNPAASLRGMIGSQDVPESSLKLDPSAATATESTKTPFAAALGGAGMSNLLAGKIGDASSSDGAASLVTPGAIGMQPGNMSSVFGADRPVANMKIGQ